MPLLHEPIDATVRAELHEYDDLTAALLVRRGITTREAAATFLSPSYDHHLNDPFLITDMRRGAERLAKALTEKEKIAVWSDYDCDGIPGGVLMHDFLKKAGADFVNYIPHRHEEGYGVNVGGIEKLAKDGAKLLITVDSGIVDNAAVARANELGLQVIVTDHHLPGAELPPAYAVIDPKRADETAPFRDYCGAGLAWKLVCATLAVGFPGREKILPGWEKWLLDMAGLATIADMVPLTGENRVIAKYGLLVMRKSPRIGLQKLCRTARVDQSKLTEDDVGFMIAPRVNAASRMGDAREAFNLFTTEDEAGADALAKGLEKANRARRAEAGAITRAVHERLLERTDLKSVIALGDPEWRPALLGLVANSIAEEYGRPVFLWGREGNDTLKGSCRGADVAHVVELMTETADTFAGFGGHAQAGGFTVRDDAVFFLEERLAATHDRLTKARGDDVTDPSLLADSEISPEEVTSSFLTKIERFAPFGEDNRKPVFLFRDAPIAAVTRFGKGNEHVRMRISRGEFPRDALEGITFFAKQHFATKADALTSGSRASVLAHIERDQFGGYGKVRLRIVRLV